MTSPSLGLFSLMALRKINPEVKTISIEIKISLSPLSLFLIKIIHSLFIKIENSSKNDLESLTLLKSGYSIT
jgi:hypothetical protein